MVPPAYNRIALWALIRFSLQAPRQQVKPAYTRIALDRIGARASALQASTRGSGVRPRARPPTLARASPVARVRQGMQRCTVYRCISFPPPLPHLPTPLHHAPCTHPTPPRGPRISGGAGKIGRGGARDEFDELEDARDAEDAKDLDDSDDPRVAGRRRRHIPPGLARLRAAPRVARSPPNPLPTIHPPTHNPLPPSRHSPPPSPFPYRPARPLFPGPSPHRPPTRHSPDGPARARSRLALTWRVRALKTPAGRPSLACYLPFAPPPQPVAMPGTWCPRK
jgi:hypothetical protein